MNFDELVQSTLTSKTSKVDASIDRSEEMFEHIYTEVQNKKCSFSTKVINFIHRVTDAIAFKECIEVALFIFILVAIPLGVNYYKQETNKNSSGAGEKAKVKDVVNTKDFIFNLTEAGYKVIKDTEGSNNELFVSGKLTVIEADGNKISIYEYGNSEDMEKASRGISKEGTSIGGTKYEFINRPHFYKKGNIIVGYIGGNKSLIKEIKKIMGEQFAGQRESEQVYDNAIIDIAYESLTETSRNSVIDKKSGKIQEEKPANQYKISSAAGLVDIKGKEVYKVTFETTKDEILGPITVYIEKGTLKVLGNGLRK